MTEPGREEEEDERELGTETVGAFSKRTLYLLVSVGVLSILFGFGLAIFGDGVGRAPTADNNTYSRSALGHHALLKYLRSLDVPLLTSQHDSGAKASNALALLLEPNVHDDNRQDAHDMIHSAGAVLLVLPKWQGEPDEDDPTKLASVELLDTDDVLDALVLLDEQAVLNRPRRLGKLHEQQFVTAVPSLVAPQLLRSSLIEPLVATDEGILFGKFVDEEIYVLSDPDILNNHGLDNGQNALLVAQIIDYARSGRSVVVDETLHGYLRKPSMWRALFEMPFVLVTIQVFLCVILLVWSGTARFGNPLRKRPIMAQGTDFLIGNTARLMRLGGHSGLALSRYRSVTVKAVARHLHAPKGMPLAQLYGWLENIEANRKIERPLASIAKEIDELIAQKSPDGAALLASARNLYHWKEEILHGPANH
tara:strand:- start:94120 stop:95388 length:1269 start_codon:yes stop_codon:yes gene_type:complete